MKIAFLPWLRTSLPVRGAWVEISILERMENGGLSSLPVRGAWVEITAGRAFTRQREKVAPRAGSVG